MEKIVVQPYHFWSNCSWSVWARDSYIFLLLQIPKSGKQSKFLQILFQNKLISLTLNFIILFILNGSHLSDYNLFGKSKSKVLVNDSVTKTYSIESDAYIFSNSSCNRYGESQNEGRITNFEFHCYLSHLMSYNKNELKASWTV